MNPPAFVVYSFGGIAEPFSAFTHLLAAGVFAYLSQLLIRDAAADSRRVTAIRIYAWSVVVLLLTSGLYHLFPRELAIRDVLRRLDHATIFVLIAATFTPIHVILFQGIWRWGMLAWIWTLAAVGIVLSLAFLKSIPEFITLTFYLGLGWLGLITGSMLYARFGLRFVRPLLFGAIAYTAGAIMDFVRAPVFAAGFVGPHEIFHLAVIAGIAYHWAFIAAIARKSVVRCPVTQHFSLITSPRKKVG